MKKLLTVLLLISFSVQNLRSGDIALIEALNKGRFYDIKAVLEKGANPNCKIGKDPALMFAINRLVEEIKKEGVSIPEELKRLIVGLLLLAPSAITTILANKGGAAGELAVGIVMLVHGLLALICIAMGVVGGVKMCRAAWRLFLTKPFQVVSKKINVFYRGKTIEQLLEAHDLNVLAQNAEGKNALDLVREHAVDEGLTSAMGHLEMLLLNKKAEARSELKTS